MVNSLNKKWKELIFAFSGFGPNLLMVMMGAYFTDAINPAALSSGSYQAIISGVCFILPAVFPILFLIAKVFDGLIDIPFAYIADTLSTKFGRHRPLILVCSVPMILSFAMCWIPIGGESNQLLNTIWISIWILIFFSSYTMCLISFYGSLSTTCVNDSQRFRVSAYKSFFDTISYCIVYALVPLCLDAFKIHIDKFIFICLPLMLTILIPLFIIKEGKKYNYPENNGKKVEKISIVESIKLTFKNRPFKYWLIVNGCSFFGLQMFLVGMNAMIIGGMGFNGLEMALVNTCAFAPVPIMLFLFKKLRAKKGSRFTYQTCLITFALAILSFFFASTYVTNGNKVVQYIISCCGGVLGSWSIGAFFMMPYLVPNQISSVEEKLTGKNHSAMYFAANAVVTSIAGAIAGSLIYENIKMLFFSTSNSGIVWAQNITEAAIMLESSESSVFNLGVLLVPFIVCLVCLIAFFIAFKMPKDFSPKYIAPEFKKQNPNLDISAFLVEEESDKEEIIFVQIALTIISGFIFGIIWLIYLFKSVKSLLNKKQVLLAILSCLIPFFQIYFIIKLNKELDKHILNINKKTKKYLVVNILISLVLPLLFMNFISMAFIQNKVNKILKESRLNNKEESHC